MDILKELRAIIVSLDNLNVPVKLIESVSIPVANASNKLKVIHNELYEKLDKKESEPEIEIEPATEEEN